MNECKVDLSKYSDQDIMNLLSSDMEGELENRGYSYGWYKRADFSGAIYIFVNPAFPNLVKIGYADDVVKRLKQLNSNSGIPDPFHCYALYSVKKRLEDLKLHTLIDTLDPDLRHSKNREFYEMTKEKAFSIIAAVAEINGSEDAVVINPYKDPFFEEKESSSLSIEKSVANKEAVKKFNFSSLGIKPGEKVVFVRDRSITAEVVDDAHVRFEGQIHSLSALTSMLMERLGLANASKSYQGPKFFMYNNETLVAMRDRLESMEKN